MSKADTAKFWDEEIYREIEAELPDWMGALCIRNSVDTCLSPREVRRALLMFANHNWGEGHPEGEDNDRLLKEGQKVFAQYRAKDFTNQPFYIMWFPENYNQQFRSWIYPDPKPHLAYVEVLTYQDY